MSESVKQTGINLRFLGGKRNVQRKSNINLYANFRHIRQVDMTAILIIPDLIITVIKIMHLYKWVRVCYK